MKKTDITRIIQSAILLLLIVTANTGRVIHLLQDDHHQAEKRVCSIDDNDGKIHLHDAHFLSEDCQLCDFVVQTSMLPELPFFEVELQPDIFENIIFTVKEAVIAVKYNANHLRGPPAETV